MNTPLLPAGFHRSFSHDNSSWYRDTLHKDPRVVDSIMIGVYSEGGGTLGEFGVRWHDLQDGAPTPRLEVFSDAWATLAYFQDFLEAINTADKATPEALCGLLLELGVRDDTPRNTPKSHARPR